jgi:hypothetical protein
MDKIEAKSILGKELANHRKYSYEDLKTAFPHFALFSKYEI